MSLLLWVAALVACLGGAQGGRAGAARLVCYVESSGAQGMEYCTHVVYAGSARGDKMEAILKDYRKNPGKIILRVNEDDKDLKTILKSKSIQGLEVHDAHRSLNKTKVTQLVEEARSALNSIGGGPLFVSLPANPELLAKYYDLRALVKSADVLVAQTHALGKVKKMTYHPSRLSGMWDMMNTDSVVDLVVGLGAPASKVLITLPAAAHQFRLANETLSTPGSPTLDEEPRELTRKELCKLLSQGKWTLERDQDFSAPYAFKKSAWISFEDASSVDVKGKYARVRGLAGLALAQADRDAETSCGPSLLAALNKVLNSQKRAPRGAVLRSLESEILSSVALPRVLDELQVSPYRITQVVDSDGVIHSVREDTRTEFTCSRQGYFVHPRTCARFYRCVKFDQLSPDYTVFEFDCPAGLAFDSRYEVCVWPGSLPDSQACPGSSEIAPVPQTRFVCPEHEGYYADPENCRWFFACVDHGKAPMSAYEFRCPFGLGFDADRLLCDWPWLVPACGNIARYEAEAFGYSGAALNGVSGFHGQSADSVNIAAHHSLTSGAALNNLVGVQGGYLSKDDVLSGNYIASAEYAHNAGANYYEHGSSYGNGNSAIDYNDYNNGEVTGSLIKDAYIHKPAVEFVNTAKYDNGNPQYIQEITGSLIKDTYVENKPVEFLSTGSYSAGNSQKINIEHGNAAAYNDYASEDVEITGSLIKDTFIERRPIASNVNVGSNDANARYSNAAYNLQVGSQYSNYGAQQNLKSLDQNIYSVNTGAKGAYSSSSLLRTSNTGGKSLESSDAESSYDDSGAYVHDNSGDISEQYKHIASKVEPYVHDASAYNDFNLYKSSGGSGLYRFESNGKYVSDDGAYKQSSESYGSDYAGAYTQDYSGSYKNDQSGQYVAGIYRPNYDTFNYEGAAKIRIGSQGSGLYKNNYNGGSYSSLKHAHENSYQNAQNNQYIADSKILTGASHTLTAGAVNVGLVGKTTLIDTGLNDNYEYNNAHTGSSSVSRTQSYKTATLKPVTYIHEPLVSISNVGSDSVSQNLNYVDNHATTLNSVGVATTATPFAVTTSIPVSTTHAYKLNFVSTQPKSDIREVFGYHQPAVTFVQPTASVVTAKEHVIQHLQPTVQVTNYNQAISSHEVEHYERGDIDIDTGTSYDNGYATVTQTVNKKEFSGYDYSRPSIKFEEAPFQKVVAYTTGQPVAQTYAQSTQQYYVQPSVSTTFKPQVYSSQTVRNLEPQKIFTVTQAPLLQKVELNGYDYQKPKLSNVQPAVSTTYEPQVYSSHTIHKAVPQKIESVSQAPLFNQAELSGYDYSQPTVQPVVSTTYKPQVYSSQTIHKVEPHNIFTVTQAPLLKQTEHSGYYYQKPAVSFFENPLTKYVQDVRPQTAVPTVFTHYQPSTTTYVEPAEKYVQPLVHKHEIQHNVQPNKYELPAVKQTYSYQPVIQTQESYAYAPEIQRNSEDSYNPSSVSHQVIHQSSDKSQSRAYESNYKNSATFVSSTPSNIIYEEHYEYKVPVETVNYKENYAINKQEYVDSYSTQIPDINKQQHSVVHTPQVNSAYKYQEQGNLAEFPKSVKTIEPVSYSYENYPKKTVESIHISSYPQNIKSTYKTVDTYENKFAYKADEYLPPVVSTTRAPVSFETVHYKQEYAVPKQEYVKSYSTVPSTQGPIIKEQKHSVVHAPQVNYEYKYQDYAHKTAEIVDPVIHVNPISFSHDSYPQKIVESIHISSYPQDVRSSHTPDESYKNILPYETDEYLPPVVSSTKAPEYLPPVVTNSYLPSIESTTSTPEYLTPVTKSRQYLPPKVQTTYIPVTTPKTVYKITTQIPTYRYKSTTPVYKAPEYLPPVEDIDEHLERYYDNYGQKEKIVTPSSVTISYNPIQEYAYKNVAVTPVLSTTSAPIYKKQNIVVQTAKSNLLGYGTVGPDAGLVFAPQFSTTDYPEVSIPVTQRYKPTAKIITSTHATTREDIDEVTHAPVPVRKTRPKIAVVTKINDFNPLLVRKLGAVCSCQSPIVVLRGKKPDPSPKVVYDVEYENDYDGSYNDENINDNQWSQRSQTYKSPVLNNNYLPASPAPIKTVTSTFNPIIVPDDSYYQDYQESKYENNRYSQELPKEVYSNDFVSQTDAPVSYSSSTEKVVRIRPRVKAVTIAPTLRTVLIKKPVTPTAIIVQDSADDNGLSQAFDRYGPGGWRSRDETLQGSVDCKRAGLFRHPKHCNKFYACRWDCTKERFTLHVFNCPVQLSFDPSMGACNWPSQGPACQSDTLLTTGL